MEHIGHLLGQALKNRDNQAVLDEIAAEVKQIATSHPMFSSEVGLPCIREQFEGHVLPPQLPVTFLRFRFVGRGKCGRTEMCRETGPMDHNMQKKGCA